jgi:hypothetical protein
MYKHEELKALVKGMNKADCVGCHEYFMNRYGADSVGPIEDYFRVPPNYWTFERVHEETLNYKTRSVFQKGSPRAYDAARRLGIMDQVCSHMPKLILQSHTADSIAAEALKYETRYAFRKGSHNAYNAAQRRGIMDKVCAHMKPVQQSHTTESVAAEALKYETRKAFEKGSPGAHAAAQRLGIYEQVCAHMTPARKYRKLKK